MARKIKSVCGKAGKRILKLWSTIFAFFLGLTGMNCPPLYGAPEYGMPYAEFTVKGKVTSNEVIPIPGIKVTALDVYVLSETACYTGTGGDYSVTFTTMGAVDMDVTMRFEDVDEAEKGSFTDRDVIVHISKGDFIDDTPGDDWDDGYGSTTEDVQLEPSE
ncbi:MAG: radical SAM-associated putative lipoprotein [Spirochaetales bacterium]|nr:radical SAM-associated putative lipoprotein [Spirochaetales bacterium]